MPLICLFGPDGSGKSTLAKILAKRLSDEGFRVRVRWMRGTHTLASILAKLLSKFNTFKGPANPYYSITIPSELRRLWQLIEFFSAIPIILLKFILPSLLGFHVIAERYTPDLITWISLVTNDKHYLRRLEARFLLALASKASPRIYVIASLEELLRRDKNMKADFIKSQLELYESISKAIGAKTLDTTGRNVNESLDEILDYLGNSASG